MQFASKDFHNEMILHWPDLTREATDKDQIRFWNYEYKRHASGCKTNFIPKKYFKKTVEMKKKINMLRDNHIKPGGFYPRSKIEKAIQKKFDTTGFGVKCFWKEEKKG